MPSSASTCNILLIHPYLTTSFDNFQIKPPVLTEPIGLMCLATYLKEELKDSININLVDLFAAGYGQITHKPGNILTQGINKESEVIEIIRGYEPDIVGVQSCFTDFFADSIEIVKMIKSNFPNVCMILGGPHATMNAETLLSEYSSIDFIIKGEGEITLKEFVKSYMKDPNGPWDAIDGLCFRNAAGSAVCNKDRALIEDINILPIPDRKLIDVEAYKKINKACYDYTKKSPMATIVTSRGCPFNCIFCSTKAVWKRKWRPINVEAVIKEIENLYFSYGIREIVINDDQFILDKKRLGDLCDYFIEKKLELAFSLPPGTSVWLLDRKILTKMKKAGFYRLCFPVESGCKETIQFIRKPIDLDKVKETIKIASSLGIWTQANFIIGFPYETREHIETTINYACTCGIDYALFYLAQPYAGSDLTRIMEKEGLLKSKDCQFAGYKIGHFDSKYLTAAELTILRDQAEKTFILRKPIFYLKPKNFFTYLFPKLKTWDGITYFFRILFELFTNRTKKNNPAYTCPK